MRQLRRWPGELHVRELLHTHRITPLLVDCGYQQELGIPVLLFALSVITVPTQWQDKVVRPGWQLSPSKTGHRWCSGSAAQLRTELPTGVASLCILADIPAIIQPAGMSASEMLA